MSSWKVLRDWKPAKNPGREARQRRSRILWQFLEYFRTVTGRDSKLLALREIAEMKFDVSWRPIKVRIAERRHKFDLHKEKKLSLDGECAVCGSSANVRHHIIQLQNGGTNGPQNLMLLCHPCHHEVHPWMKSTQRTTKRSDGYHSERKPLNETRTLERLR